MRPGWRGGGGKAALQVSALALIWGVMQGSPILGVFRALLPPLLLPDIVHLAGFGGFLASVLGKAWPWALGALALALAWRPLRAWAPGLALSVLMLAGLVLGEEASRLAMCDAARAQGLAGVERAGLSESLARMTDADLRGLHGLARAPDGGLWGWSYRQMTWVALPAELSVTGALAPADCAP